jgi:MEMO1 family protein
MLSFVSLCPPLSTIPFGITEKGKQQKTNPTIQAMEALRINFQKKEIQDVILISSHDSLISERMTMTFFPKSENEEIENYSPKTFLNFPQNLELNKKLIQNTEKASIPLRIINTEKISSDFFAPLYSLTNHNQKKPRVLKIVQSKLGIEDHFKFGQIIYRTVQESSEKIALIASENFFYHPPFTTSTSHFPKEELDQKIIHSIQSKDFSSFFRKDQDFLKENTGKEHHLSIVILLGFLHEWGKENWKPKVFSDKFYSKSGYAVIDFVNR